MIGCDPSSSGLQRRPSSSGIGAAVPTSACAPVIGRIVAEVLTSSLLPYNPSVARASRRIGRYSSVVELGIAHRRRRWQSRWSCG
jgi:hypothetical protein